MDRSLSPLQPLPAAAGAATQAAVEVGRLRPHRATWPAVLAAVGGLDHGISLDSLTPLSRGLFDVLRVDERVLLQAARGAHYERGAGFATAYIGSLLHLHNFVLPSSKLEACNRHLQTQLSACAHGHEDSAPRTSAPAFQIGSPLHRSRVWRLILYRVSYRGATLAL
jgi:hypothetical protein